MKTGNIANKDVFKYDEYSHGIDWLSYGISDRSVIEIFFTNRIFDLDTDNSNFGAIRFVDEHFSITKTKTPLGYSYYYSVSYEGMPIPIFVITEFNARQSDFTSNQWGIIHFYGAYYRLIELEFFSDKLIETIHSLFLDCPISRLDYRFDFCSFEPIKRIPTIEEVLPNIRKNKFSKDYGPIKNRQSWDVGKKGNKTVFIRLYNKLQELGGNLKKLYLYSDIDKFQSFIRLEYEFGNKWCAGYTGKDLPDLIDKAFKTSGLEESSFKGNLYKPQLALDLSDKIDKLRYIKIFKSMAKNLKNNGIDPILIIESIEGF